MSKELLEFWIHPSKAWDEETKSFSKEEISVQRINNEDDIQKMIIASTEGIHVIEYKALDVMADKFRQMQDKWLKEKARSQKLRAAIYVGKEMCCVNQSDIEEYDKGAD